jgi:serine/threonine protein kinase
LINKDKERIKKEDAKKRDEGDAQILVSENTLVDSTLEVKPTMTLDDFKIIKVLDKGSFGKVFLTMNIKSKQLYAMKRIDKDILIEKK